MDTTSFWKMLDNARLAVDGDADAQLAQLETILAELAPDDIVDFSGIEAALHRRAYTWDLWAAAYIINGGCSDDGFLYFRGWLILQGEKVFEAAMKDPQSLLKVVEEGDDCEAEGLDFIAGKAWAQKTGRAEDDFPYQAHTEGEPGGEPWDDDDLEERFPKLTKKFYQ